MVGGRAAVGADEHARAVTTVEPGTGGTASTPGTSQAGEEPVEPIRFGRAAVASPPARTRPGDDAGIGRGLEGRTMHQPGAEAAPTFTGREVEALRRDLAGPLFLPSLDGYDGERLGFNRAVDPRPALIVGAATRDDVATAVRFAAEHGLPVAVKTTGHGASVPVDGAVLITTERMARVSVDPAKRTATIGAGTVWRLVVERAAPLGLAPLAGSSPGVGVIGYATGGGAPIMGRTFGWGADRVRRAEIVTADGSIVTAAPGQNEDLLWAVKGGKGNFGVVTELEVDLLPVRQVFGGSLAFPGALAPAVLRAYSKWIGGLPDGMSTSIALMRLPDMPVIPEPIRGQFFVTVRICFVGEPEDGEALIAPLRAVGTRIMDGVGVLPYSEAKLIHNDPTEPGAAWDTTAVLSSFGADAVDALMGVAGPGVASPLLMVEVRHLGGAMARPPASPSAVGNRDAAFSLYALAPAIPGTEEVVSAAMQGLMGALAPFGDGRVLLNFLGVANGDASWVRRAFAPEVYRRLAALKAVHDPANLFRLNHNIPPAA